MVNEYIEDQGIKDLAERALWLGNDETHYLKKWIDKDLHDLKFLIEMTCYHIHMVSMRQKVVGEMAKPKPKRRRKGSHDKQ